MINMWIRKESLNLYCLKNNGEGKGDGGRKGGNGGRGGGGEGGKEGMRVELWEGGEEEKE